MDYVRMIKDFLGSPGPKERGAIRVGLLGASNIAPIAIIVPAKSHPEVIVAAVAARDEEKARKYAKKHQIPIVHKSYQDLLDDPALDAVYIALPNGLHYEWAFKALKAGKHVLLEKPSTSNAKEASSLFKNPLLSQANSPVLLEAVHTKFHPAWQAFVSLLDPPNITYANSIFNLFANFFPYDDIRYNYELSGGVLMDMGAYTTLFLRDMLGVEPEKCSEAIVRKLPKGHDQNVDQAFDIKWRFPNGAIGEANLDLAKRGGYWFPLLTESWPSVNIPKSTAIHSDVIIKDDNLKYELEHVTIKTVTIWNAMAPQLWHRIDVEIKHEIREKSSKKVTKTWKETEYKKAYTFLGEEATGKSAWSTYRYMLDEFVNRIKGREGSGVWMTGDDSIGQMAMIDSAYEKAGLPLRPTSTFL